MRRCLRSGDVRRSDNAGDAANGPAPRSGLIGKRGMGGDIGNLVGDGGEGEEVPLGLSVSFANLAVLRWMCCGVQI